MNSPILSFLISTHNNKNVILSNVNNILKIQSDEIEIVVADDFSNDNTVLELEKINDSRLIIVKSNETKGHSINLINAISNANGKYVFFLKEEHTILTEKIQMLLDFLQKDEYDVINTVVEFLEEDTLKEIGVTNTLFLIKAINLLTSFDVSGTIIRREFIDVEFLKTVDEEMLFGFSNIYINSTLLDTRLCSLKNSFVEKYDFTSVKDINEATMFINIISIWLLYSNITDGEKKILSYQLFVTFTNMISFFIVQNRSEFMNIKNIFVDEFLKISRETDTYEQCQEVLIDTAIKFIEQVGKL